MAEFPRKILVSYCLDARSRHRSCSFGSAIFVATAAFALVLDQIKQLVMGIFEVE
jgi:hypothetical protein